MIRQISGRVLASSPGSIVVEVAGFGLRVFTNDLEPPRHDTATLFTHLALKQDGLELYGFRDAADRDFFELLLTVTGVGTKTALGLMRRAPRESLLGAISSRDLSYLTKVVGLGKKSAEKMVIELADKVGPRAHSDADADVFDMLIALGYTEREARTALQKVADSVVGNDARLKAALSVK